MAKVFLDAGHGGHDPGACGNGLREKDVVLDIVLRTGRILQSRNVKVAYSRQTDVFVSLMDIARKANESGADVFVSVHANASRSGNARGVETYSVAGYPEALELSRSILGAIAENRELYKYNRGAKHENFTVLTQTTMDAVLVECAFIDQPLDAHILRTRTQEFAEAIAEGILRTLGAGYAESEKHGLRAATAHDELLDMVQGIVRPSMSGAGSDRAHWARSDLRELNGLLEKEKVEGITDARLDDLCTRGEMIRIANLLQRALRQDR